MEAAFIAFLAEDEKNTLKEKKAAPMAAASVKGSTIRPDMCSSNDPAIAELCDLFANIFSLKDTTTTDASKMRAFERGLLVFIYLFHSTLLQHQGQLDDLPPLQTIEGMAMVELVLG
ncbi:unnamed protein product [Cylindrotheca closterium]|uniref:Uncharacterized protein n=1 Tax=Cylindrotheca closterium TaxID=2856 RepID=A0AAD2PY89_9STRA|nr:unnamed protein product [Cylindrotheca closterium]